MTELVDHLACPTAFRHREVLDVTRAGVIREMLQPISAATHRKVGEPGDERWATRARQGAEPSPLFASDKHGDVELF